MGRRDLAARGRQGEVWAERALRLAGYRVLARRWRVPGGEIDIVAEDRAGYAFVEVKARRGSAFGHPEEAISPRKLAHLHRAAERWLLAQVGDRAVDWRVDVVAVEMDGDWLPYRITIFQFFDL